MTLTNIVPSGWKLSMSDPAFCFWSVADGAYASMMAACIHSARRAGVTTDFHVWTDRPVAGAICHPSGQYEHRNYFFKFDFLLKMITLPYDYFIFLDADNYFVRHPGNLLRCLRGAPVHVCLESDCTRPDNIRPDWWGCLLPDYVQLMRDCGVRSRSIFNTNAGFWIVHRDVVQRVVELATEFQNISAQRGYNFTEEAPLAYVGHMLMGNPYIHTLAETTDIWASDWTGVFAGRLPTDEPWHFIDYMNDSPILVNPAIVHCMRSKEALIEAGSKIP